MKMMLRESGLSQGEVARRAGISQGSIYKLVSGNAKSSKKIVEIAQALGVRAEWLMSGNGKQYIEERRILNHTLPRDGLSNDYETLEGYDPTSLLRSGEIEIPFLPDIDSAFEISPFPFQTYNGQKMRIDIQDLKNFGVDESGSDLLVFIVSGDSMDPILPEGSKIGINLKDKRIVDGKVYAIDQSGWRRIRMLYRSGPTELTLKSFNSDSFPDEKIAMSEIEILGRAFFSQRSI